IIYENNKVISKVGFRNTILNDLSPIATFISTNYNSKVNMEFLKQKAIEIFKEVDDEFGWMYKTTHENGKEGIINYTVWSEVFACPNCSTELVFWEEAVENNKNVKDEFKCPNCKIELTKRDLEKVFISKYDELLGKSINEIKYVPVLINYTFDKKRYNKKPDQKDLEKLNRIDELDVNCKVPINEIPDGEKTIELRKKGITHVHRFYTKRNLLILSSLFNKMKKHHKLLFLFTS